MTQFLAARRNAKMVVTMMIYSFVRNACCNLRFQFRSVLLFVLKFHVGLPVAP